VFAKMDDMGQHWCGSDRARTELVEGHAEHAQGDQLRTSRASMSAGVLPPLPPVGRQIRNTGHRDAQAIQQ